MKHDRRLRSCLKVSLEAHSSIIYATLIALLAIVPVFLMTGLGGALFRPLAVSYVVALARLAARGADGHSGAERRAARSRTA